MRFFSRLKSISIICACSLLPFNSFATVLIHKTFQDLTNEAELIFVGTVTDVAYKLSEQKDNTYDLLPFTFVTFKIEKILKGQSSDNKYITLRLAGGYIREKRYLRISGIPLFDKGDEDVIYVKGNEIRLCPIVGWKQGRFRIIGDYVFSDLGSEILLDEKKSIKYGDTRELEEITKNKIGKIILTRKYSPQKSGKKIIRLGKHLGKYDFIKYAEGVIKNMKEKGRLEEGKLVKSADIKNKIIIKALNDVSPKIIKEEE